MLVSFDGLDSSGKATQARLLSEHLTKQGVVSVNFRSPDYEIASGKELKLRLQGKLGDWQHTPWQEKMGYFAANRMEHLDEVKNMLARGGVVIYDRYVPSSIAFMIVEASHSASNESLRGEVQEAVENLEYIENAMPKEDISIFFDVPPKLAIDLLKGRKKDQSDENEYTDYLHIQEALHGEYVRMAHENPSHMVRISCMDPAFAKASAGKARLRSIEEIALLVREALAQKFPGRAQLFI